MAHYCLFVLHRRHFEWLEVVHEVAVVDVEVVVVADVLVNRVVLEMVVVLEH